MDGCERQHDRADLFLEFIGPKGLNASTGEEANKQIQWDRVGSLEVNRLRGRGSWQGVSSGSLRLLREGAKAP